MSDTLGDDGRLGSLLLGGSGSSYAIGTFSRASIGGAAQLLRQQTVKSSVSAFGPPAAVKGSGTQAGIPERNIPRTMAR